MLRSADSKIITFDKLPGLASNLHQSNRCVVSTNGCFDILHLGHLKYLQQARELGDVLLVALNSDSSVKQLKGEQRPIHSESVRAQQLAALEAVDYVCIFEQPTPEAILRLLQPSIHVKGGDYTPDELPEKKIVEASGGKLMILPFVEGYSTTKLIEKLV